MLNLLKPGAPSVIDSDGVNLARSDRLPWPDLVIWSTLTTEIAIGTFCSDCAPDRVAVTTISASSGLASGAAGASAAVATDAPAAAATVAPADASRTAQRTLRLTAFDPRLTMLPPCFIPLARPSHS